MNHEEVAKKVASDHFAREQRGECPIAGKLISDIAAALRRQLETTGRSNRSGRKGRT